MAQQISTTRGTWTVRLRTTGRNFTTYAVATRPGFPTIVGDDKPHGFDLAAVDSVRSKIESLKPAEFDTRCKAFAYEDGPRAHRVRVDEGGAVSVLDPHTDRYTMAHHLSDSAQRRIRAIWASEVTS